MRAVVLAAGEGTRLRPYTLDRPKCLVPLAGEPLLAWQTRSLRSAGIEDITVVTGYRAEQIRDLGYATAHNSRFAETNMVASLMCASRQLDGRDAVLIAYGDLVYEPRIVQALAASTAPIAITVDASWRALWEMRMEDPLADAETLRLDPQGNVTELGKKPSSFDDIQGQYMGLIKVSADLAPRLVSVYEGLDPEGPYDGRDRDNMYMTSFLQYVIDHVSPVAAVVIERGWLEVDTVEDLDTYEAMARDGVLDRYFAGVKS